MSFLVFPGQSESNQINSVSKFFKVPTKLEESSNKNIFRTWWNGCIGIVKIDVRNNIPGTSIHRYHITIYLTYLQNMTDHIQ